jgi:hypothetical protein
MKLAKRRVGIGAVDSSGVSTALTWLGGGAVVGAGLGALTAANKPTGALSGAMSGVALVGVGGLVVAVISKANRPAGFATAGIGLGGLALLGLATSLIKPAIAA